MKIIYIIFFAICFFGCAGRNKTAPTKNNGAIDLSKYERLTVVDMRSLDGCGFILQKNDGTQLNPLNLPDSLSKKGKVILVKYVLLENKMTTCMAGQTIQITDIKFISK